MTTDTAVMTKRKKLTRERYPSGKLRGKKERENDSAAPPATSRRFCYICNTTVLGDSFTTLSDEDGVARAVHLPVHAIGSNSGAVPVDITPDCLRAFESRVADANRQRAREHQEDLALAASKRQQAELPQRGYDCPVEGCKTKDGQTRFFDSANGRDLHARKAHKQEDDNS